jgi:hypothetical protein
MSKDINTIDALRNHALKTLKRLREGEIDVQEAAVTGKVCDVVIHTIKAQIDYHKMLGQTPQIPFMANAKLISVDIDDQKMIENK